MILKGYYVKYGYMGWVPELNRYLLFCSDTEYLECVDDTRRISLAPATESALPSTYITESAV